MSDPTPFDLAVLGAGPGGYVAAIRAAQLGLRTAIVEGEHLGGICLNWGCIPTKALLRSAEVYSSLHHLKDYGLSAQQPGFDLNQVVARSRGVAQQLSRGVAHLLKKNKVTVFNGFGTLAGGGRITVKGKDGKSAGDLQAPHIIIATGARARSLPGLSADGRHIWTYREAMVPDVMPKSLLVIGSGAIGIEFASFYRQLGAEVTVAEVLPRILNAEDEEISAFAHKAFVRQGIRILTGAKVGDLVSTEAGVTCRIAVGETVTEERFDRAILAIGITGNVEGFGLEQTRVKVERGHIQVDPLMRTDEPGLYAIGDVVGPPWLAHKASHEGVLCVEAIAGRNHGERLDVLQVPGCTYCTPQIASIGLSEARARAEGRAIKVGRFPFLGNGKAIALGHPEGMVKTIFDAETGQLLGAHMIGAEVTELIQGYAIAMKLEATEQELMHTIFPHPTLSEMMHEAVLDAYGQAIHF